MKPVILFHPELKEYDFGENHVFRSNRFEIFLKFFQKKVPKEFFEIMSASQAEREDLLLICQPDYIDFTEKFFQPPFSDRENPLFFRYHSQDNFPSRNAGNLARAGKIIIGQAKKACDLIWRYGYKKVVSLGGGLHHAHASFGEGFCLYNDVAFAGFYLLKRYALKKILILDTDAHFGNGTYEYFKNEPRVLLIDIHQDPATIYPGYGFENEIGQNRGKGLKINIPLPPKAGDLSYKMVFEQIIFPVVQEFKPEIIIRNGGSDPHFADLLTDLGMTINGFYQLGKWVEQISHLCQEKEIDLLASGYNLKILPYCWYALLAGILNFPFKLKTKDVFSQTDPTEKTREIIQRIKSILKPYWKCFKK